MSLGQVSCPLVGPIAPPTPDQTSDGLAHSYPSVRASLPVQALCARARSKRGENNPGMAHIVFPKGRLGNGVAKAELRVDSIMLALSTAKWRDALKDTTLRGFMRSCAGLEKELEVSEYPAMVRLNDQHNHIIRHLLELCSVAVSFGKDESENVVVRFREPLEAIRAYMEEKYTGASAITLDAELAILQVSGLEMASGHEVQKSSVLRHPPWTLRNRGGSLRCMALFVGIAPPFGLECGGLASCFRTSARCTMLVLRCP